MPHDIRLLTAVMVLLTSCEMERGQGGPFRPLEAGGTFHALTACPGEGVCGDGCLDPTEHCDDGNSVDGDYCSSDCLTGIDTTGTNCSESALQDILDAAVLHPGVQDLGTIIDFPRSARIRVCDADGDGVALHLRGTAILNGNGTELQVPVPPHTDAHTDLVALSLEDAAQFSTIRDLAIRHLISSGQEHGGVGIDVNVGQVRMDNIRIANAGRGIVAESTPGATNVNGQSWRNITITGCSEYGVYINGGDANGGLFERFMIKNCLNSAGNAVALYESSFLGNAHIGHLIEGNNIGILAEGPANRSTFTGIYVEGSDAVQAPDAYQATAVGGQLSANPSFIGDRIGGATSRVTFSDTDKSGHALRVTIPFGQDNSVMDWSRDAWGPRCNNDSECLYPHDTCELYHPATNQYRCWTPGARDRWALRHHTTADPSTELRWDVINRSHSWPAFSFSIREGTSPGWYTRGGLTVGNDDVCDYATTTCGL